MSGVYDKLYRWAKKTTSFAELVVSGWDRCEPETPEESLESSEIYRLRHWPELPDTHCTADIYRTLSVMSNRPVNRHWILSRSRMRPEQVDNLIQFLRDAGAVEVINSAKFATR